MTTKKITLASIGGFLFLGGLIYAGCAGYPRYQVWSAGKAGEAELKKAEQNRQIKVLEAQAELESSKLKAQSEVERAKGVAEANKIVADGLKGHDEYLRYLWIEKVAGNASKELVYVPTEAGLPILEAGRR
jgi:regulator of protease activity HflC (stomatin/prohibitin superfamily)